MIFIDSNVPMYVVGADHPHKTESLLALQRLVARRERLVTDAEVLQEILHRFAAIRRLDAIDRTIATLRRYVDAVLPVTADDVLDAKDLLLATSGISARDALHAAVMSRHGITEILSFDRGFDRIPGIVRIDR